MKFLKGILFGLLGENQGKCSYFGLMMDGMVGPSFDKGLANIKKIRKLLFYRY